MKDTTIPKWTWYLYIGIYTGSWANGWLLRGTTIFPVMVFEYSHPSSLSLFHTIYDLSQGVGSKIHQKAQQNVLIRLKEN